MAQKPEKSSGIGRSVIKHKSNDNFGSQLDLAEAQSSCAGENMRRNLSAVSRSGVCAYE